MKLTTRGRYAVTAMLDLACHTQSGPISLSDIAQRQEISLSYLEQLFAKLRRHGLVHSVRGPGGGYILSHDPDHISVAAIISAVDDPIQASACESANGGCPRISRCITHDLWQDLGDHIHHYLESISLGGLITDRKIHGTLHDSIPPLPSHDTRAGA